MLKNEFLWHILDHELGEREVLLDYNDSSQGELHIILATTRVTFYVIYSFIT